MIQSLTTWLRCTGGPVPNIRPRWGAYLAWSIVLVVRLVSALLPTRRNREFKKIAREILGGANQASGLEASKGLAQ